MKKIRQKILFAIILTCMILSTVLGINNISYIIDSNKNELELIKRNLVLDYDVMIKNEVQTAVHLLEYAYEKQSSGELTEVEAKLLAKNLVKTLRYGEDGYFWIDDTDGYLIAHPILPEQEGKNRMELKDPNGTYILKNLLSSAVKGENDGFSEFMWERPENKGTGKLSPKKSFSKLFEQWNWVVSTGNYIDQMDKLVDDRRVQQREKLKAEIMKTVGFSFGVSILTFILAVFISNNISKPIAKIVENVKRDADGRISIKKIDIKSKDEIGELAAAINAMNEQVRGFVEKSREISKNVTEHSINLSNTSQETSATIESVAKVMEKLTQGVSRQAESTMQSSKDLESLSSEIQSVVGSSTSLKNTIKEVAQSGKNGLDTVHNLKETFAVYSEKSDDLASIIDILVNKSQSIESIIGAIQGIAGQTNLLALNASIEAARAGDSGLGFAVLADEIKKLSESTALSAKQIEQIIKEIQSQVSQITNSLGETTALFEKVGESISITGNSFANIQDRLGNTISEVDLLFTNAKIMDDEKNSVISSIKTIKAVSEHSAESAQEVSASLEEQTAAIAEIANAANALEEMTKILEQNINGFKV